MYVLVPARNSKSGPVNDTPQRRLGISPDITHHRAVFLNSHGPVAGRWKARAVIRAGNLTPACTSEEARLVIRTSHHRAVEATALEVWTGAIVV